MTASEIMGVITSLPVVAGLFVVLIFMVARIALTPEREDDER